MKVRAAAYNYTHKKGFESDKPQGTLFFLLFLAKSPVTIIEGGKSLTLKKNQMYIFERSRPRHFRIDEDQFIHDWVQYYIDPASEEFVKSLELPYNRVFDVINPTTLSEIIKNIAYEWAARGPYRDRILDNYIKCLLMKTAEMSKLWDRHKSFNSYNEQLHLIRGDIYNYPERAWKLEQLAKIASMSSSHFQHTYRKLFGCSFMADVIQSRIRRAKEQLTDTNDTMEKVAEVCGYHNVFHFIRQFKKYTGNTPSEYRKKALQK